MLNRSLCLGSAKARSVHPVRQLLRQKLAADAREDIRTVVVARRCRIIGGEGLVPAGVRTLRLRDMPLTIGQLVRLTGRVPSVVSRVHRDGDVGTLIRGAGAAVADLIDFVDDLGREG